MWEAGHDALEVAVVVADDSDLIGPVKVAQEPLRKSVFVIRLRNRRSAFALTVLHVYRGDTSHQVASRRLEFIVGGLSTLSCTHARALLACEPRNQSQARS